MRVSDDLLYGPPEDYGRYLALEGVRGMTRTCCRGRKRRATLRAIDGQVQWAKRNGASEEQIRAKVRQGITDSLNADPGRVKEVERRFLQ